MQFCKSALNSKNSIQFAFMLILRLKYKFEIKVIVETIIQSQSKIYILFDFH